MDKSKLVHIKVYATNIQFLVNNDYELENGLRLDEFMKSLTEYKFNYIVKGWLPINKYILHNRETGYLIIPRFYLKELVDYIQYYTGTTPIIEKQEIDQGTLVDFTLNSWWKLRDDQIPAWEFLVKCPYSMRALPLIPGFGKTVLSLFTAATLQRPFIIIVEGLIEQWYNVILNGNMKQPPVFDIEPEDVYLIQGQNSLVDLCENTQYNPKIIVASLATIRNYVHASNFPYSELPTFDTLMKRIGIGTKIIDEAHRAFSTIVDIDLHSNIANNIYLSATLTRSDRQSKRIFMRVFPDLIRYKPPKSPPYKIVYYLPYTLGHMKERKIVSKRYGYNHNKYENFILSIIEYKLEFLKFINNCFASYYLKIKDNDEKCMIMASSRNMCDVLLHYFKSNYPELKVNSYYGNDNDDNLKNADVIISSVKKGSTGVDVKKLRTFINTVSIGSEIQPIQIIGRLRKLENNKMPIYVAMYNKNIDAHIRHYKFCKEIYRRDAKEFYDLTEFI